VLDVAIATTNDGLVSEHDELDRREAERIRRRDREASARERDLLRPGMGKVFKQIQDAQRKAAADETDPTRKTRPRGRPA
jgi:hypothetical protein